MEDVYKEHEVKVFGGEEVGQVEDDQLQEVIKKAMLTSASLSSAPAAV